MVLKRLDKARRVQHQEPPNLYALSLLFVTGVKIGFSIAVPRTPPEACFLLAFLVSGEVVRALVWAFQPKLLQVVVTAVRWSIHLQAGRLHQVKPLQPVSLVCRVLAQVTDLMSLRQT
ncbi:MAG: hypothetical protein WCE87_01355 [Candidatus Udaeobacter sp.]